MEEQAQTPVPQKKNTALIVVIAIILVAVVVATAFAYQQNNKKEEIVVKETPSENTLEYKDGTYDVIGTYTSPGGAEELGVSITLENGIIKKAVVTPKAFRPISKVKQADFTEHYQTFVIGKNINEVKLDKVSGSSLSPKGFNDALEKVKAQAQVQS